jgi:hypothetical protein
MTRPEPHPITTMARVAIILEDLPNGTLRLSGEADAPISEEPTNAQLFGMSLLSFVAEGGIGAPISEVNFFFPQIAHYDVKPIAG